MSDSKIKVSIVMLAYNHEKFIEQAIESILEQDVDFKYELLIGEDCSTDRTREIVEKYQRNYPDMIKVVRHNKNIGMQKNVNILLRKCEGAYIAYLEGDDYWICPKKLKFQADFLDAHPEYIGVTHNVKSVGERGEKLPYRLEGFHHEKEHIYTKKNALNFEIIGHMSGLMYRNIWKFLSKKELNAVEKCKINGDQKVSVVLGLKGDIYYFEDVWSVYRRCFRGNNWSARFRYKNMSLFYYENNIEMKRFLRDCYRIETDIEDKLLVNIYDAFLIWKTKPSSENRNIFLKMIMKRDLKKRTVLKYILVKQMKRG